MISISELHSFFERYRLNLEQEKKINHALLSAGNQENWLDSLYKKAALLHALYLDNEALLDHYLRPVLCGEVPCSDEAAAVMLQHVLELYTDDLTDDLCVAETLHFLVRHFEKSKDRDRLVIALHMLGGYYNLLFDPEEGQISADCFSRIRSMKDWYFETQNSTVRRYISDSFYNYPLVCGNWELLPLDDQVRLYDEACAFLDDPAVKALAEDPQRLANQRLELDYDILGNPIQGRDTASPLFLSRSLSVLRRLYREQLAQNPNPYAMPDEIYLNYLTAQSIAGEISRSEYILAYKDYCDHILNDPELTKEDDREFYSSHLFQVYMSHLGWLLHLLKDDACPLENREELRHDYMKRFIRYVSGIPKDENSSFVNGIILYTLKEMLSNSDDPLLDVRFILDVTVCRDATALLSSIMTRKLAVTIVNRMLEEAPQLLVGVLGTGNVMDVLEKRREILDFFSDAAQIYDIGKLYMPQIAGKHTRTLTEREWRIYHRYPKRGWEPLCKSSQMLPFRDIIMGHKRSWDGESGYPEEFDIVHSPDRRFISLISICDRLNEAASPITGGVVRPMPFDQVLDEIRTGAGTLYDPQLSEWLCADELLCRQLETLCTAGRGKVCFEVYRDFIAGLESQSESMDELFSNHAVQANAAPAAGEALNQRVLNVLARSALLLMQIHLPSGSYRILHRQTRDTIPGPDEGSCVSMLSGWLRNLVHPEDWRSVYQLVQPASLTQLIRSGQSEAELEFRLRSRPEGWRWTRLQCSLLDAPDAVPSNVLITLKDIDESRRQAEQMHEAMLAAYRSAEAANKAKSSFLSSMSHDIRTPMNVIIGMTRLAMKHADEPDRVTDYLQKISDTSDKLLKLINEVLDISKIESGSFVLNQQPLNLQQLIDSLQEEISTVAGEHSHTFTVDTRELRHIHIIADGVRLNQVLQNLLSNAVKYTPDGGRIEFIVQELDSSRSGCAAFRFTVRDNGIGMSGEFQKNLFKPFQREETAMTRHVSGTGLGMSITQQIVNAMSGSIQVDSVQNKGTEIRIILRFAIDRDAESAEASPAAVSQLPQLTGRHILLAEDNPLNREIACELLEETGALITTAEDGMEAVEQFTASAPFFYDLIFMDIQMPRMNGYEAARTIRTLKREDAVSIPIVAMTADVFTQDVTHALQSGMSGHLAKPLELPKLYRLLNTLLRTPDADI